MPTYSINQMSTGFLTFGGLLMGYGGFGDMIYKSERQRWLGVMRYPGKNNPFLIFSHSNKNRLLSLHKRSIIDIIKPEDYICIY